ncbi:putative lipid II flippase FtsW [Auritidibacter ignavus]|uniref:putative lipid II flippase FtsW n=1 Tax=Auritidibacter ignavus TaxID=678932 RepID=UPI002447DC80|nr:putative lipid II flippase FtsW [Auritidibacter ignavus]WGH86917.1 putative lipid II flippase FtsW [Auritidibacter ignavus]WGH89202.1 putative lipid II flippase FtsW [Auritidibacter ignavus]WHS34652.1 putative lipid II flippase FtsW [Auritidibacter ignavus]
MSTADSSSDSRVWRWLEGSSPKTSYWLILGSTLALSALGVLMVLSASSVENIGTVGSYDSLLSHGVYALAGVILMVVVARLKPETLRRLAWGIVLASILLLVLVFTPLGHEVNGNRNWLRIGGFSFQPAEAAKLGLALWGGHVLALKGRYATHPLHLVLPVVPVGGMIILLVLVGRDLGTGLVLLLVLAVLLFMAGIKFRWLALAGIIGLIGVAVVTMQSDNRMLRIGAWFGNCDHPSDPCYQSDHGFYALASGGWWGVGLGQSRQKWSYIPEAENDFIFTILGEELGLLGALATLALFIVLAIGMFRVAIRTQHAFVRITTGAIIAWLIGQAFLNIAMVTGLLPVIGVPLPFISRGGSAMMMAMLAVGVVLSFTRQERRDQLAEHEPSHDTTPLGPPPADAERPSTQHHANHSEVTGTEDMSMTAPVPGTAPKKPSPLRRPGRKQVNS